MLGNYTAKLSKSIYNKTQFYGMLQSILGFSDWTAV